MLQVGLDAILPGPETQRKKNMKSKSITLPLDIVKEFCNQSIT